MKRQSAVSLGALIAALMLTSSAFADQSGQDAVTTAQVVSKLQANQNTRKLQISVETRNGIVRLRGEVRSAEERELAALLARNTGEVMWVQNDLVVRSGGVARNQ
jgi:osmotically-inducible protein OsmY